MCCDRTGSTTGIRPRIYALDIIVQLIPIITILVRVHLVVLLLRRVLIVIQLILGRVLVIQIVLQVARAAQMQRRTAQLRDAPLAADAASLILTHQVLDALILVLVHPILHRIDGDRQRRIIPVQLVLLVILAVLLQHFQFVLGQLK